MTEEVIKHMSRAEREEQIENLRYDIAHESDCAMVEAMMDLKKILEKYNNMIDVKIVNKSKNEIPSYATDLSAGMDLRADLTEIKEKFLVMCDYHTDKDRNNEVTILPGGRALIGTGLYIQLPEGYEAQVRPRSGLALKNGITVLNTPGTIDADYRGEIGVILYNASGLPFVVKQGERIAQMVIAKHEKANLINVETLDETDRGEGGFGHTGVK